eukprot:767152-Hanusia_phi.AAC.3
MDPYPPRSMRSPHAFSPCVNPTLYPFILTPLRPVHTPHCAPMTPSPPPPTTPNRRRARTPCLPPALRHGAVAERNHQPPPRMTPT